MIDQFRLVYFSRFPENNTKGSHYLSLIFKYDIFDINGEICVIIFRELDYHIECVKSIPNAKKKPEKNVLNAKLFKV